MRRRRCVAHGTGPFLSGMVVGVPSLPGRCWLALGTQGWGTQAAACPCTPPAPRALQPPSQAQTPMHVLFHLFNSLRQKSNLELRRGLALLPCQASPSSPRPFRLPAFLRGICNAAQPERERRWRGAGHGKIREELATVKGLRESPHRVVSLV